MQIMHWEIEFFYFYLITLKILQHEKEFNLDKDGGGKIRCCTPITHQERQEV